MKLVSVIIPVYNGELFLEDTIRSVLSQDYNNIEIIIIDDNSSDNSLLIINKMNHSDERIKSFKNKSNLGVIRTVNIGISHSSGHYLLVLGQDDLLEVNHISTMLKYFDDDVSLVYCKSIIIDEKGDKKEIESGHKLYNLSLFDFSIRNRIHSCGLLMKRDNLFSAGLYRYNMKWRNFGEWDLWIRLLELGKIIYCDEVKSLYRKHSTNMYYANKKNYNNYRRYALDCMRMAYSKSEKSFFKFIKYSCNYILFYCRSLIKSLILNLYS